MPSTFKALASIAVWILFLFGCLSLLGGFVRIIGMGGRTTLPMISFYFGYGILSLTLSVVAAKLRQTMQ